MTTPALPLPTSRADLIERLATPQHYDLAIVGGGATGLGLALDAAARGFFVVLVESHDFAKGTSSRASKLLHGGVRYLARGNISLVRQALHERRTLLANAPHLAQPLAFVMPCYRWWETPFYGAGLKLYDALAGKAGLGATAFLSRSATLACLPNVQPQGLRGGIQYWDGQFDDARFALALARTAAQQGSLLVNYCAATGLLHQHGKVTGLQVQDQETGQSFALPARCVVNATGVWVDALRQQDGQATGRATPALVTPSQGIHLVMDRSFWPTDRALLIPRTADGRVLFVLPWLGKTLLGTTDTPCQNLGYEPLPLPREVDFILRAAAPYLSQAPGRADIKSLWVGLRPLVKPLDEAADRAQTTQALSREHTVHVSPSGLVTVTGGKWTTYRVMAEDVLDHCARAHLLPARSTVSEQLPLVGAQAASVPLSAPPGLHLYGSEAPVLQSLPGADRPLGGGLSEAMVRFAARYEYARSVEDVLARRWRLLFLDAALARSMAPQVAAVLVQETGCDPQLPAFVALCGQYLGLPDLPDK